MTKWISVKDELPAINKNVLINSLQDGVTVGYYDSRVWFNISEVWAVEATHWMPLPEPPKQ